MTNFQSQIPNFTPFSPRSMTGGDAAIPHSPFPVPHCTLRTALPPVIDRGLNVTPSPVLPPAAYRVPCAAFTLVELLMVILILAIVAAVTVPMMLPALDSRRIREAARIVNTQFASAQSQALANGRSAGVWIERLPNSTTAAMDLYLCEVPPPYAGSTSEAVAKVSVSGNVYSFHIYTDASDLMPDGSEYGLNANLIRPGDLIKFDYRGPLYSIAESGNELNTVDGVDYISINSNTRMGNNGIVLVTPTNANSLQQLAGSGLRVPFQIYRQPVKSSAAPVSLPVGTIIDLSHSGPATDAFDSTSYFGTNFRNNTKPVLVMFSKTGELESVLAMGNQVLRPGAAVHFLVGKSDKVTTLSPPETNLVDLENLWVSINPQSGLVSTSENLGGNLSNARSIAASAQTMGGR